MTYREKIERRSHGVDGICAWVVLSYLSLHLYFEYTSSPISELININSLITTIIKIKIVSLIFNVRLKISLTPYLSY